MINWMDNFQIYGTDGGRVGRMSNGVYAEVLGLVDLVADPDPTAAGLFCLLFGQLVGTRVRKVLPTARTTIGIAARYWLVNLPNAAGGGPNISVRDTGNNVHCYITCDPSGNIQAYRHDTAGDVLLGATTVPPLIANAWKHVEAKFVIDAAAGSVEVRVEQVTVLTLAGIRTSSNVVGAVATVQNVQLGNSNLINYYTKDFIIWDGTGGFNNDFMGSCQVLKIIPDGDVALNWTPSTGLTGYNLINEVTPDDDTSYITAPSPAPAPYKCSLSDLPVYVTVVKGVMPIHRSRKTDGGTGNIQLGVVSGAATGLGVDRPITTAYTYWWDVFDSDPNIAAAWTKAAVNAMNLQLNRTA
jgi:hypothetical protein